MTTNNRPPKPTPQPHRWEGLTAPGAGEHQSLCAAHIEVGHQDTPLQGPGFWRCLKEQGKRLNLCGGFSWWFFFYNGTLSALDDDMFLMICFFPDFFCVWWWNHICCCVLSPMVSYILHHVFDPDCRAITFWDPPPSDHWKTGVQPAAKQSLVGFKHLLPGWKRASKGPPSLEISKKLSKVQR